MSNLQTIIGHEPVSLTTDHSASSYGIPVLVYRDVAYGPADTIPGTEYAPEFPGGQPRCMTAREWLNSCVERSAPIVQGDITDSMASRF